MSDGTYAMGSFLPPQRELAEELGVSRDTIQKALRELIADGWIESRQGSGSRVIKTQPASRRGVTLGHLVADAFERPEVRLDVYTLTSESLAAHIRFQVERVEAREIAPERIAVRLLLPHQAEQLAYPRTKDDPEDQRLQERLRAVTRHHTNTMREVLAYLRDNDLVSSVDLQVRRVPLTPTFKLYLVNGVEAIMAPYVVTERQIDLDSGEVVDALDVLGLGATLTRHLKDENDPNSPGSVFVESMSAWFESVWNHLAE
ncbi:MAG: GntR family transcriptional regulator [Streptomyces sp.]|nr:GntR family transcriptional regulator [Streptomyces sp.]